ncbi:MAG TPA: ABC transporter permease [Gammaproteobacteria bacterium]|nr:ABC transporter permease [Gammaproteobacteria bacterium]
MTVYRPWIAFSALLRSEVRRFMRIWTQTLLPSVITMVLYFVIFGNLVGSQLKAIDGFTYMQYITPGLVMMSVVTNSYLNTVSSFYFLRFQRSMDELVISPMSNLVILLGFVLGGTIRGLLVGALVLIVGLFFAHLALTHIFLMVFTAFLAAMMFSLMGLLNGMYARSFDDISIIPTFVLTPLTYLGGVFYSIHMLSPFWQKISYLNPILYIVNALRYGLLGVTDIPIYYGLSMMVMFVAVLFAVNLRLLNKGVGIRT